MRNRAPGRTGSLLLCGVLLGAAPAAAQPPPAADITAKRPATASPGSAGYTDAPGPREASGVVVPRAGNDGWRMVPRVALFTFRWIFAAVFALPRAGLYAYDRYALKTRFREIFFNDAGTVGLFPTAFIETGYGANVGARFVHRDLFGAGGDLRLRGGYGGLHRWIVSGSVNTGSWLSERVELGLHASAYDARERFYGIGNGDQVAASTVTAPIDPLADDVAVASRLRHHDVESRGRARLALTTRWSLAAAAGYRWSGFADDADAFGDEDVHALYDTAGLVGYDSGLSSLAGEVELAYDGRRVRRLYMSPAAPSSGHRIAIWAGYQHGLSDDPSRFSRWGAQAQRFFDLYDGTRVLSVRLLFEGVSGQLDQVPFVDLPTLGGPKLLRGYARGRFRDRYAGAGSVEYSYPVSRNVTGYGFVEAGRVWRRLDELTTDDLRIGYGGGIQLHSSASFMARLLIATNIDGELNIYFTFDPIFDVGSRRPHR